MLQLITRNWWVFVVRGVLAIVFGILAFTRPDVTLVALVAVFGVYALLDGIMSLAAAPMASGTRYFGWVLLDGLLGVAVGVLTFVYPVATAVGLIFLLGAWLVISGIFEIALSIELRKEIQDEWLYLLGGMVSIGAGLLTFYRPGPTALAWMWVMAIYALLYGVAMLVVGFKMHKIDTDQPITTSRAA